MMLYESLPVGLEAELNIVYILEAILHIKQTPGL